MLGWRQSGVACGKGLIMNFKRVNLPYRHTPVNTTATSDGVYPRTASARMLVLCLSCKINSHIVECLCGAQNLRTR